MLTNESGRIGYIAMRASKIVLFWLCLSLLGIFSMDCAGPFGSPEEYMQSKKMVELINAFRAERNLPKIPYSPSLTKVATSHLKDLVENIPHKVYKDGKACDMFSWSDKGSWKSCCYASVMTGGKPYIPTQADKDCIWGKPMELTNYPSKAFEWISEHYQRDPKRALDSAMKVLNLDIRAVHMLTNQGTWKDRPWKAIGAAVYQGYVTVWVGVEPEPTDKPKAGKGTTIGLGEAPLLQVDTTGALLVQVKQENGASLAGAKVFLHSDTIGGLGLRIDGQSGRSEADGNVQFADLPEGRYVVAASAPGKLTQWRSVTLSKGHILRLEMRVKTAPANKSFPGAAGGSLVQGRVKVTVPPSALLDVRGKVYTGSVLAALSFYDLGKVDLLALPGPLKGLTKSNKQVHLRSFGALSISFKDAKGNPLRLGKDKKLTLSLSNHSKQPFRVGQSLGVWSLEHAKGLWKETLSQKITSSNAFITKLSRSGYWLLASTERAHCVRFKWTQGAFPLEAFTLTHLGALSRSHMRLQGTETRLENLDGYPASFSISLGKIVLKSIPFSSGVAPNCQTVTIDLGALTRANSALTKKVGQGKGRLLLSAFSGHCPAAGVQVKVTQKTTKKVVLSHKLPGNVFMVEGLGSGSYEVEAFISGQSKAFLKKSFSIASGCGDNCAATVSLQAPASLAKADIGGCWKPTCRLDSGGCNTCAKFIVKRGLEASGVKGVFSAFTPVNKELQTDDKGGRCVDVPNGRGKRMVGQVLKGGPVGLWLSKAGSCGAGTCEVQSLYAFGEQVTCPKNEVKAVSKAQRIGFTRPARFESLRYQPLMSVTSTFSIRSLGSNPFSPAISKAETFVSNQAFGFVQVSQDILDRSWAKALVVRTKLDAATGLSFAFEHAQKALEVGSYTIGEGKGQLQVGFRVDDLKSKSNRFSYQAIKGSVRVIQRDTSRLWLLYENVIFKAIRGESPNITLKGQMEVPLHSGADVAWLLTQRVRMPFNGGLVTVKRLKSTAIQDFGPSGWSKSGSSTPAGHLEYCVPGAGPFMMVGKASPRLLRPFSAIQEIRGGQVRLFGNALPSAARMATFYARWIERSYVQKLYAANRLQQDRSKATIIGAAFRVNQAGVPVPVESFQVHLQTHNGKKIQGIRLLSNFKPASTSQKTTFFFFPNVPPTSMDKPYTLRITDAKGEIQEFTQKVAPVADGVMIPYN